MFWHCIWHSFWHIIYIYILTFYLPFFLAFYLASILTYFLAYMLTFFLASMLAFYLASFQAFVRAFDLASILAFYLPFCFYLAFSLAFPSGMSSGPGTLHGIEGPAEMAEEGEQGEWARSCTFVKSLETLTRQVGKKEMVISCWSVPCRTSSSHIERWHWGSPGNQDHFHRLLWSPRQILGEVVKFCLSKGPHSPGLATDGAWIDAPWLNHQIGI